MVSMWNSLAAVLAAVLLVGCLGGEKIIYVCVDGREVSDPGSCPTTTAPTTTTTTSTTTTTTTTTSTTTTTTTTLAVACRDNGDCGIPIEKRICYMGNVYMQTITPMCKLPGKPTSYCVERISWNGASFSTELPPYEECSDGCVNGTCIE
jgi:phage tail sheath gpL-like